MPIHQELPWKTQRAPEPFLHWILVNKASRDEFSVPEAQHSCVRAQQQLDQHQDMGMGMRSLVFAQGRGTMPVHILACAKPPAIHLPPKNLYSRELIGAAMEKIKHCCK